MPACWVSDRLVHKQYRDYDEAVKCYKNALRMDKESQQVLRDLAGLQVSTVIWQSNALLLRHKYLCPAPIYSRTSVLITHELCASATV